MVQVQPDVVPEFLFKIRIMAFKVEAGTKQVFFIEPHQESGNKLKQLCGEVGVWNFLKQLGKCDGGFLSWFS